MARRDQGAGRGSGSRGGRDVPPADSRITPGGWRNLEDPTSSRTRYQLIAAAVLGLLALLFVALNSKEVETRFIVFSVSAPLWVSIVISLTVGIVAGWFLHVWFARRSR